jgi:pilus assembly protein Flp/PilA
MAFVACVSTKALQPEFAEKRMLSIFRRLMKSAEGATAIEYTLIASLIAVAAIASMRTVGGKVSNVLNNVSGAMN